MTDTITVDRDAMAHALAVVGKVTPWAPPPKSVAHMSLGLVRIDVADGKASLSSANADRSITATFPAAGGTLGASFPAILVERWISKARPGNVIMTGGDDTLSLASAKSRATVPTDVSAMPPRAASSGPSMTVTAAQLHTGLTSVIAVPKDDVAQPYLGAVLIHGDASSLGFVATDSNRVHEVTCAPSPDLKAVLPNDTARALLAVLPNDTATAVDIIVGERSISFATSDITVTSALMQNGFPSVAEKFAQAGASVLTGCAADILADIDLVATVSDMKERDFTLSLGAKCMASATSQSGGARGEVQILAQWHGAPLDISFALRPVRDALLLFGDEHVEWHMDGQLDATVITSAAAPELRALVAPFLPRFQPERMAA